MEDEKGKKLKCQRCGYVWNYMGKNEYVAQCPHCMIKVAVGKNTIE